MSAEGRDRWVVSQKRKMIQNVLVECGILESGICDSTRETGLLLIIGIRNLNATDNRSPKSTAWDSEFKTFLVHVLWSELLLAMFFFNLKSIIDVL